jgi:AraC-like DNA-binding protein
MKFEPIRKNFVRGKPGHVTASQYFYFETQPAGKQDLAIVCGGWEKCGFDYEIIRRSYPYYVVKYTLSGKGTFIRAGQKFDLAANSISGFAPGDQHSYRTDPQKPMEHIFIIFTGSKAHDLFTHSTLSARSAFKSSVPAETTYLLKSLFKTACTKPAYAQQICEAYLVSLLLKQAQSEPLKTEQTGAFKTYLFCKKYIDQNFLHDNNIAAISRSCDINIRYMARLFRKYSAMTPHQYIMRLRLNKAADMLLNSHLSVVEIGFASGFQDPYHFSKSFKKFHDLAPSLYRQLHLGTNAQ